MSWVPSAGFDERTLEHHASILAPALAEASCVMMITHASRGEIQGRTTGILRRLSEKHGLREVTLLMPQDAPHGKDGYALEKSAPKAARIASLLGRHADALLFACKEGRVLVAGRFAWQILGRLGGEVKSATQERRVLHPCHWMNRPVEPIRLKLASALGETAPDLEQLCSYINSAHREALRARWKRMTPAEKKAYRKLKTDAYAALPQEEKDRRAQLVADAYAGLPQEETDGRSKQSTLLGFRYWEGTTAREKLLRTRACRLHRKTPGGRRAWREALRIAKAKMDPEVKTRVMAAMRSGYAEKMTPEKRKQVGSKRRAAWTAEKREAARQRNLSRPEAAARSARALEMARAAKLANSGQVASRTLVTCAGKLVKKISEIQERVESGGAALSKPERRTLRERSQYYLDQVGAGKIELEEGHLQVFRVAIELSREAGAASKSTSLKQSWATERRCAKVD